MEIRTQRLINIQLIFMNEHKFSNFNVGKHNLKSVDKPIK